MDTKKQHYVPQAYLREWCIPNSSQMNVYDKISHSFRKNNIEDVASANRFYDAPLSDFLSKDLISELSKAGFDWKKENNLQWMENALASEVDNPFSILLKTIKDKVSGITPWHIDNCFFIDNQTKAEFSFYLAIQYLRTKMVRESILQTSDRIVEFMDDLGIPKCERDKYQLSKQQAKIIHLHMMSDSQHVAELMNCFYRLTWILGLNRTEHKLYTSDNPIGTYGHIKDSVLPMNGIASKGVEAFFPVTPDIVLIMVDGSYHRECLFDDNRYVKLTYKENIDFYNSILVMQSSRSVFSYDGNFDVAYTMNDNHQ